MWMVIFGAVATILIAVMLGTTIGLSTTIGTAPTGCTLELIIPCLNVVAYYLGVIANIFVIFGKTVFVLLTGDINSDGKQDIPFPFNVIIVAIIGIPAIILIIGLVKNPV